MFIRIFVVFAWNDGLTFRFVSFYKRDTVSLWLLADSLLVSGLLVVDEPIHVILQIDSPSSKVRKVLNARLEHQMSEYSSSFSFSYLDRQAHTFTVYQVKCRMSVTVSDVVLLDSS